MKKHLLALATGLLLGGAVPQYALAQQSEDKFLDFNPPLRPNSECLVQWVRYFDGHPCQRYFEEIGWHKQKPFMGHPFIPNVLDGFIDTCGKGVFPFTYNLHTGGRPDSSSDCHNLNIALRTTRVEDARFDVWYQDTAFMSIFIRIKKPSAISPFYSNFCSDERWSQIASRPVNQGFIEVIPEDIDMEEFTLFREFCTMLRERYGASFFVLEGRHFIFYINIPSEISGRYVGEYIENLFPPSPVNSNMDLSPDFNSFSSGFAPYGLTSVKEEQWYNNLTVKYVRESKSIHITIEHLSTATYIEILSLRGELIAQYPAEQYIKGGQVSVDHLANGVYFVRYGSSVKKIMIGE